MDGALYELTINRQYNTRAQGRLIDCWSLKPHSRARVFPDYIPKGIRADYEEACSIRELSPKASATLSRRCLQGILRDFWQVKAGRLVDEIAAIKDRIDPLVWDAIEAVRKVGNIGAHMEKDVNVIIDVDPNEAGLLIGLIELLLKEWYIHREERRRRLEEITCLATLKAQHQQDSKSSLAKSVGQKSSTDAAG